MGYWPPTAESFKFLTPLSQVLECFTPLPQVLEFLTPLWLEAKEKNEQENADLMRKTIIQCNCQQMEKPKCSHTKINFIIAYTKICNIIGWEEYNIGRISTLFSLCVLFD